MIINTQFHTRIVRETYSFAKHIYKISSAVTDRTIRGCSRRIRLGQVFSQSVSYIKPIPTHEQIFAVGKNGPKATFNLLELGLGWPPEKSPCIQPLHRSNAKLTYSKKTVQMSLRDRNPRSRTFATVANSCALVNGDTSDSSGNSKVVPIFLVRRQIRNPHPLETYL